MSKSEQQHEIKDWASKMFLKWIYWFDLYFHLTSQLEEFQLEAHPAGWLSASQYILSNVQPLNASRPIEVTLLGITMLVSDVQPLNALLPIEVTLSGILMELRDEHRKKAPNPIIFMVSGRLICFRFLQPLKLWSAIWVTILPLCILGIVRDSKFVLLPTAISNVPSGNWE